MQTLSELLIYNKYGGARFAGELKNAERFINCGGQYQQVWDLIATEFQLYGGDAIINVARGRRGLLYRDILISVCKKMKVNFNKFSAVEKIEDQLLGKVIADALEKMTEDERRDFVNEMDVTLTIGQASVQSLTAAFQAAIKAGGFKSYQTAMKIANAISRAVVGKGLSLPFNAALVRVLAIRAGPAGWIAQAALAIPLFTGVAYCIVIPAVIQIAYMRKNINLIKKQRIWGRNIQIVG